jgi:hypothetical protein
MAVPAPFGTSGDASVLDSPPPSPALDQGMNPGMPLGALVPQIPSTGMPPEILRGILEGGEQISTMLDSFAQITPDLARDWAMVKEALMIALSRVAQTGAPPTSPTAPGPNYPGGGFERGGMPLASGG